MFIARNDQGAISGAYACPQPDAVDNDGNVICPGIATVEIDDDDPELVAYLAQQNAVAPSPIKQLADLLVSKNVITAEDADSLTLDQGPKP